MGVISSVVCMSCNFECGWDTHFIFLLQCNYYCFPSSSAIKNPSAVQEVQVWFLVQEDPLEKEMATNSSIVAWEIPWTEDLVGYSPWSHRGVRHDWATKQQRIITTTLTEFINPAPCDSVKSVLSSVKNRILMIFLSDFFFFYPQDKRCDTRLSLCYVLLTVYEAIPSKWLFTEKDDSELLTRFYGSSFLLYLSHFGGWVDVWLGVDSFCLETLQPPHIKCLIVFPGLYHTQCSKIILTLKNILIC